MTAMLLPGMPQEGGEPVFAEPWQAQAFAMALALHERGLFSWPEWAEALSTQITAAQAAGDADVLEEGLALRGTFVINPDGVVKTAEIHDNAIARDVKETLRKLQAAQYIAKNPGQVCPAKWQEGAKTIAPSLDLVGKI